MYRFLKCIVIVSCYFPFLHLIIFYTYVLRAIVELGRIPSYDNPDPKKLGFSVHRDLVYCSSNLPIISIVVIFLFKVFLSDEKFRQIKRIHIVLFVIGFLSIIVHIFFDPLNEWFLD